MAVVPAAEQTSRPAVPATGEFLTRAGGQLLLGGKPFRAIGVNKRELLDQYLADLLGRDPRTSRNLAIKTLDGLADRGIDVIRICATQYWPGELLCTFPGDDRALRIAWQRFDEMLADCAQRRIRLVVSIGFYPGLWSDLAHERLDRAKCRLSGPGRRPEMSKAHRMRGRAHHGLSLVVGWQAGSAKRLGCRSCRRRSSRRGWAGSPA